MAIHAAVLASGRKERRGVCWAVMLLLCVGCGSTPAVILPNESTEPVDIQRFELVARFVHLSDSQIVDEESPGRLTAFAALSGSAWRPQEAYSTQLLDGMIRTVNKMHVARLPIDFVLFTGDATDNAQHNELRWFLTAFDGGLIDPLTGPDDRAPEDRPDPLLDPHQPFTAQGLYRHGVHGDRPTITWYVVFGNHDHFAGGVFPIVTGLLGQRTAPLPLQNRIGLFLPLDLNPVGWIAWAPITPAHPGPPPELNFPMTVPANPMRRFITDGEFVRAHLESTTDPPGHGFDPEHRQRTWYSVSPVPGLRLIGLNSATPLLERPTQVYADGAISLPQLRFLRRELERSQGRREIVIVATHHPSGALQPAYGSAFTPLSFRDLLNKFSCVKLHLAGHWHRHVVIDRGGYLEIVTGSVIDAPQQGRIVEIWRTREDDQDGAVIMRYWTFSHLDEIRAPDDSHGELFDDPLLPMRRQAAALAGIEEVLAPP